MGVAIVVVAVAGVAIPLAATSTPDFFARYHLLNRRYVNLEHSAHEHIGCRSCHETQAVANGVQLTADYYRSIFKKDKLPKYFQFSKPSNAACMKCHEQDWADSAERISRIPHPAHQRVANEERPCVQCHKWTAHLETYMPKHKEMPFSGVCVAYGCHVGTKTSQQCYNCHHVLHDSADEWKTAHPAVVKQVGENSCLERCHTVEQCQQCHTTGQTPKFNGLKIEIEMKPIEKLHVRKDWTSKYHGTEALADQSRCFKCHQDKGYCDECHRQRPAFHGSTFTWLGRHQKVAKTKVDPRCIICHDKAWCEKCHAQFQEME